MKIGFFEFHYLDMTHQLDEIHGDADTLEERVVRSIPVIQKCLTEYREYLRTHEFEKKSEEILFFKIIKPKVVSKLIYQTELFNWWTNRPNKIKDDEEIMYWQAKKNLIRTYFREHTFLGGYLTSGSQWLDTQLFVTENRDNYYHWGIPNEMDSVALYDEPHFSTSHDHLTARLLAYSELYRFCEKQMNSPTEALDFKGVTEGEYDAVPLLQTYKRPLGEDGKYIRPRHIPRNELDLLLERFMQDNLRVHAINLNLKDVRMTKRMRRRVRKFLAIWGAENRDVKYEPTPGYKYSGPEEWWKDM